MGKMAAQDGITHLVATPHANYIYQFDPVANAQKLAELQAAVGEKPKLLLGCDFHLSYDNIQQCIKNPRYYTINGTSYLLVEFPEQFIPEQLDRVFYDIEVAGLTPILTHPERNPVFQRRPELLQHYLERGCLCQVTAQSYLGRFGGRCLRLSEKWLDGGLIHFFSSDAHDATSRPPVLSPCYRKVAEVKGQEIADFLMTKNPEAVISGLPLPPQPEPPPPQETKRKQGWFSFLR